MRCFTSRMCRPRFPWARRSSWPGASRAMRPLSSSVAFCGGQEKPGSLRVPSGNQNIAIGGWSMDKRFGGARDTSPNTPRGRWEEHRARFEAFLEGLVFSEEPRLAELVEAMRYSMLGGGKRVRPTLCIEVADVFGAELGLVLPSAAAIELIHTYSLVHDDLPAMDDDDYRRGRPATHKKYGEGIGLPPCDALFWGAVTLQ